MGWGWCNSNIREDYREEVTLLRDLKKVEGRSQARCNSGEKKSFPGREGTGSSKTLNEEYAWWVQ